jgi:hypothetical protein
MICLSFDTDWMSEDALQKFLQDFPLPGRGTFFCHEAFRCLQPTAHEQCPHPFISDLENWQGGLAQLRGAVNASARGVRTHSCVFSHMIALRLHEMGFEYVSNTTAIHQTGLAPFRHPWGVWELPIYYMDNMDFWAGGNWPGLKPQPFDRRWIDQALQEPGLYVFDFHPIHVALNTRTPDDYQSVKRRIVEDGVSPFELTFPGRGSRVYFQELCDAMRAAGQQSVSCSDALDSWIAGDSSIA